MTGGDGRAAGNFTAANVPAPLGDIRGPGLEASKAFLEFVLSNDSRLWNVYSTVIPENSSKTGEKKSVLTSNEGWTKQWVDSLWVLTLENSITLSASWMYLQNEKEVGCAGERRKLLRQLSTTYLSSTSVFESRCVFVLFQRASLHWIWPHRMRVSPQDFTKSESWYSHVARGNRKADASTGKICLWWEGTAPSKDFSTCLIPSLFQKALKHIPDLKCLLDLNSVEEQNSIWCLHTDLS